MKKRTQRSLVLSTCLALAAGQASAATPKPASTSSKALPASTPGKQLSVETALVDRYALQARSGLPSFTYQPSPDAMPNYVAGAKWGTEAEHIRTMQAPLSGAASLLHYVLQPGFAAELWAEEPQITKPIAMAWDERGRLWIAETVDYPNEMQPVGQGRDRIKICEDTDGDGRADKFTVFADKLSIPTSIVFANGGVIVSQAPDMLFLKDTDGDGVADVRQTLFSGWGTGDTHAGPSNLRAGLDNWIWGTVGYSGFEGVVGGQKLKFGMGVFRFKPDGSAMEFVRSSNNNTWGLGLSEEGVVFGSTANRNASFYMSIPNRFYEQVSGWSAARMETIADNQAIYPITTKVRQVDQHGMYTAGAGHALYTARAFPKEYWNRVAFVTEPTGHLVGWFRLDSEGSDYKARNLGSFMASDDEWSAPIAAEVGPDGAVWVLDWYNYIVQHNPTPVGFKTGKGNAYETSLRDKRHGRIYRVVYMGQGKPQIVPKHARIRPPLGSASEQLSALKLDNQLWRLHAQRLLVEGGRVDAVPGLLALVADRSTDEIGLNPGALHALWTLHGLGVVKSGEPQVFAAVVGALKHPSAGVRRAAVSVLPRDAAGARALLDGLLLSDSDPQVRLAAALAVAEMAPQDALGEAVAKFLSRSSNSEDAWLREAGVSAAAKHHDSFVAAYLKASPSASDGVAQAARIIARHHAASITTSDLASLLKSLKNVAGGVAAPFLDGLAAGLPEKFKPTVEGALLEGLQTLAQSSDDAVKEQAVTLSRRWGADGVFAKELADIETRLRDRVSNPTGGDKDRLTAGRSLVRLKDQPETIQFVLSQINLQTAPALANGLIAAAGESRHAETGAALIAAWKQFTPAQRRTALTTLARRVEWARSLVAAVESQSVPRGDLGNEHWQQLRSSSDKDLAAKARTLAAAVNPISADREEVVRRLLPLASKGGDVARGQEVFKANCAVCHVFRGEGSKIGPELTGIGARPRADVLVDILDPNRSVEANYRMWNAATRTGETISGRLDAETATSIEITDLTGQKHVLDRKDIASLESSNLSIMPAGFESIPEADIAALMEFLAGSAAH